MSEADIDKMVGLFGDILFLAESIFSICNTPTGSLTDVESNDVEETIEPLS